MEGGYRQPFYFKVGQAGDHARMINVDADEHPFRIKVQDDARCSLLRVRTGTRRKFDV